MKKMERKKEKNHFTELYILPLLIILDHVISFDLLMWLTLNEREKQREKGIFQKKQKWCVCVYTFK